MTAFVALLRAVNVGGRKLLMAELRDIGQALGLEQVGTFIASGNLLFVSDEREDRLKERLEQALRRHMGAEVGVMIRTAEEMRKVAAANPFDGEPGNRVAAIFLDSRPPADVIDQAKNRTDEDIALGARELYVHYPSGMGRSKLAIRVAREGTARNMNSVERIAAMLGKMQ